uniref:Murine leukemia virus integrase C-terminal domain-containing protein n=1 Tax=Varanus komodoensis TaxID=61221 RepID=A0A8D2LPX5_VARKO
MRAELSNHNLLESLQALDRIGHDIRRQVQSNIGETTEAPDPAADLPPRVNLGDWVWLKNFHPVTLGARWLGPFQVILSTPTVVRLDEKPHWFHVTQIKPASPVLSEQWTVHQTENPLRVKLKRVSSQQTS